MAALSIDLFDCVLDHLASPLADHVYDIEREQTNRRALRAASLIARRWTGVAQQHLCRTVILDDRRDVNGIRQATHLDLARVRSLTLGPRLDYAGEHEEVVAAFVAIAALVEEMSALRVTRVYDAGVVWRYAPDTTWRGQSLVIDALAWRQDHHDDPTWNREHRWLAGTVARSPTIVALHVAQDLSYPDTQPWQLDEAVSARLRSLTLGCDREGVDFDDRSPRHVFGALRTLRLYGQEWTEWEEDEDGEVTLHVRAAQRIFGVRGRNMPCLESVMLAGSASDLAPAFGKICTDLPPTIRQLSVRLTVSSSMYSDDPSVSVARVEPPTNLPRLEHFEVRVRLFAAHMPGRDVIEALDGVAEAFVKRGVRCSVSAIRML